MNSFEEEYHFEDERRAVLLRTQRENAHIKRFVLLMSLFTKARIFQAPEPLISPAQKRVLCVCLFYICIYCLPDARCSFRVGVSLHTLRAPVR